MSRELSVGIADCFGKSDLPFLRCEGYFTELTELTAMMQLQIDKDHSFDAYFPAESSASSLQDVTKLEFIELTTECSACQICRIDYQRWLSWC